MSNCIGWLFDVYIEHDQAVLWIKTIDKQILKLIDSYQPSLYILPRNESDGLQLFQILSQQDMMVDKVRWENDKLTNLFDHDCTTTKKKEKLICVYLQSTQYYTPILKLLEKDQRVKQFFNTDLSHIQQYLFTKLGIEPTSKVKVEYDGTKLLGITKVDDEKEVSPPLFSLLYFDVETFSGKIASEDPIRTINVRYEDNGAKEQEPISFQSNNESTILQDFSSYLQAKDPDIVVCMGESESKIFHYLFSRIKKLGLDLQFGREVSANDLMNFKRPVSSWIKGRICLESCDGDGDGVRINGTQQSAFDSFGFAGLIERSRFGFLPLGMAARYSINRLIDSRNGFQLIQRGFVISNNTKYGISNNNNHEHIRTIEQIVSRDKGGMIISPQIGLHENVVSLDCGSKYANLCKS